MCFLFQKHICINPLHYNTSVVYCRELAPGTVSLTGDWARGDDSKQYRYYTRHLIIFRRLEIIITFDLYHNTKNAADILYDLSGITRGVYGCRSDEIFDNPSKLRASISQTSKSSIGIDINGFF